LRALHRLGGGKHRDQRQQAQAGRVAIDAMRVDQRLAQHLQAAADAQHRPALRGMCGNGAVQALGAQAGQVAAGVFGAGQDDPVGTRQVGRAPRPFQIHAGQLVQRLKFVEVADAWGGNDSDGPGDHALDFRASMNHAIFLRQAMLPPHRQHGHGGHAGQVLQPLRAGFQQRGVTPELVQHKTFDARSIGFGSSAQVP
jgi:hypothetical protein